MGAADFSEFYAASYDRLLPQVVLVTGDLAEAEDLLQEAFVRAAGRWPRLASYQAPEAWVRRVALNLAADSARRLRRRAAAVLRLASAPPALDAPADLVDLAAALRRLSVGQRQAIVLHHLVGLSVAEVAWELGVPVGTVKTRLARGRRALARWLSADLEQEEEVHGHGR